MFLKCIKPEDNWSKCTVRILSKGKLYENYLDATNAARKAEYTSDINSDDGKRKKFPTRKQLESSNESSSDSDKENDGVIKGLPLCPASLQTTKLASLRKGQKKCAVKVVKDDIITVEEKETREEDSSTGHNTNAIKALVTEFVKLNRKMDLLMADVSTLVNSSTATNGAHVQQSSGASNLDQQFPINDLEELDEFERKLMDKVSFEKTVEFISRIGGVDVNQFVKRVISRLLSNQVQKQLNWLGQRGDKKSFKALQLCKALTDGILKNNSTSNATEISIEKAIKNFLRHAADRMRSETKVAVQNPDDLNNQDL